MKPVRALTCLALLAIGASAWAADIRVPEDAPALAAALAAASPGDTIRIGEGEFAGDLTIDKPVRIRGQHSTLTSIAGAKTALTVGADVILENLTVRGAENGILVRAGLSLQVFACAIEGAASDGIGFENSTETSLEMNTCLVTGNGDGVDLEGTQGLIVNTTFVANKDDGLDYDGDARVTCANCRFIDNGDDGVEVRIRDTTEAIFTRCEFSGNGEDGLEIINSPLEAPVMNVLVLGGNRFQGNKRWGLGFVTATQPEEAEEDDFSRARLIFGPNEFADNGKGAVSPNHAIEMQRAQATDTSVTIRMTADDGSARDYAVPLHPALPVATVSMRPALAGGQAGDIEGIALMDGRMVLADDNFPGLHVVDLRTRAIVKQVRTKPIPGTDLTVTGTEGLSVTEHDGKRALLMACDDDNMNVLLDATEGNFGAPLSRQDAKPVIPYCEGIEQIGGRLYAVYGTKRLKAVRAADLAPVPGLSCLIEPQGYGQHSAGIGFDGARLLIAVSAYAARKHTHYSLIIAMDPDTLAPIECWHVPYLDDPRGIAWGNGLAWMADGMSPYPDPDTGRTRSVGLRAMAFALDDGALENLRLRDIPGPLFELAAPAE